MRHRYYLKIDENPLEQETRKMIYKYILINPAFKISEIEKDLKISRSSLLFHLNVLIEARYIKAIESGSDTYYLPYRKFDEQYKVNKTKKRIVWSIKETVDVTQSDLLDKLKLPQSTLSRNLKELRSMGLIYQDVEDSGIRKYNVFYVKNSKITF